MATVVFILPPPHLYLPRTTFDVLAGNEVVIIPVVKEKKEEADFTFAHE